MPPTAPPPKAECARGGRAISSLQSPGGSAVVEDEGVLSPTRWRTGRRCYAPATASVALHHSLQLAVGASVTAVKAEAASEREARGRGPGCSSVGCGGFVSSGGGCGGGCGTYARFYLFITVSKDPFIALRPAGRLSEAHPPHALATRAERRRCHSNTLSAAHTAQSGTMCTTRTTSDTGTARSFTSRSASPSWPRTLVHHCSCVQPRVDSGHSSAPATRSISARISRSTPSTVPTMRCT